MRVSEAEKPPRFYGFAWWDWTSPQYVCALWPLNYVAAIVRAAWLTVRFGMYTPAWEKALAEAWGKGFQYGVESADRRWLKTLDEQVEETLQRRGIGKLP